MGRWQSKEDPPSSLPPPLAWTVLGEARGRPARSQPEVGCPARFPDCAPVVRWAGNAEERSALAAGGEAGSGASVRSGRGGCSCSSAGEHRPAAAPRTDEVCAPVTLVESLEDQRRLTSRCSSSGRDSDQQTAFPRRFFKSLLAILEGWSWNLDGSCECTVQMVM